MSSAWDGRRIKFKLNGIPKEQLLKENILNTDNCTMMDLRIHTVTKNP
jgi:hypothetical protein